MAEIAPFRGLRYNRQLVPDLADVVIPPYDVISPQEQEDFHKKHPFNFIRLELGAGSAGDTGEDNPHTRAAAFMKEWIRQQVLVRNSKPSIYYYELDYSNGAEGAKTRTGFICLMRLEDFSGGGVRPHEKTFSAIKRERLSLMQACEANLSPVFALYSDRGAKVRAALASGRRSEPEVTFTDYARMTHRMWPVTEPEVLGEIREAMEDKAIFIADGHHRYETALNYRNLMRQRHPGQNPAAAYEFIMMYLTDMDDPGLTILPTHRLLRNLSGWAPSRFIERAKDFFEIRRFETVNGVELKWKHAIEAGSARKDTAIGFYCREEGCVYVLTAKKDKVYSWLEKQGLPAPLRALDVVVLDQVVLRHLLDLSEDFLGSEHNISFIQDFSEGLDSVKSGGCDAGFFINPTRIEQVREVANSGLIMPHKSTYFYPKVSSGLVVNSLRPDEETA